MGRIYAVSFQAIAYTAAGDFFEITPADDKPIAIHAVTLGGYTETGDAAEEMLRWSVIRGYTTSGSGGSSFTPVPLNPSDAAAGFTAEIGNTTGATTGTAVNLHAGAPFNVRVGLDYEWTPERRPKASQANTTVVVRLLSTPADSITFDGTLIVEEF